MRCPTRGNSSRITISGQAVLVEGGPHRTKEVPRLIPRHRGRAKRQPNPRLCSRLREETANPASTDPGREKIWREQMLNSSFSLHIYPLLCASSTVSGSSFPRPGVFLLLLSWARAVIGTVLVF